MAELEEKITAWRAAMSAALRGNKAAVCELEEHLRDQIEALSKAGKPRDEAFADAVARIGSPGAIGKEFEGLRGSWLPESGTLRAIWGLLALLVALLLGLSIFNVAKGNLSLLLGSHVALLAGGYLTVMAAGLVGLVALVKAGRRSLPEWERDELRRQLWRLTVASCVLVPVGFALGMVWLRLDRGVFWTGKSTESGALIVLASSWLLLFAQLKVGAGRFGRWWGLIVGVSTLAVARSGLGTSALTAVVPIGWLWLAFIVSQCAVVILGPRRVERSALPGLA